MEKTIFVTNVGSHLWGMNTPTSDLDLMVVYQESTRDILEGRLIHKTKPDKTFERDGVTVDQKEQEIGHLVNKLIDGNVSAIWTVCTPIIIQDHPYLKTLRRITEQNLSKASYASIKGMAISQFKDHTKRAGVMPEGKALKTAWRTCTFGQMLLLSKEIQFKPAPLEDVTVSDVEWILNALDFTYKESPLPDYPDEKPFRDFLFDVRIDELTRRNNDT